jgi:NAD(P)H-quinone oxidoreductase subunit 2
MLAYSSISQAGYMLIGLVAENPDGYTSMTAYMLIYTFMNLGALACVVLFGLRTGSDQIRDYTGLFLRDPWLTCGLSICLLSLGGIPPLAGFFAKLYLFWAAWQSGLYFTVSIAFLTSVISIYFYLRVVKVMLTKQAKELSPYVREYAAPAMFGFLPSPLTLSMTLCVCGSVFLGLGINPIIVAIQQTAITSPLLAL